MSLLRVLMGSWLFRRILGQPPLTVQWQLTTRGLQDTLEHRLWRAPCQLAHLSRYAHPPGLTCHQWLIMLSLLLRSTTQREMLIRHIRCFRRLVIPGLLQRMGTICLFAITRAKRSSRTQLLIYHDGRQKAWYHQKDQALYSTTLLRGPLHLRCLVSRRL